MAMIPMKRLLAVVPHIHRDALLKSLMGIGCVEITEAAVNSEEDSRLRLFQTNPLPPSDAPDQLRTVKTALEGMDRFCKGEKKRLFLPLRPVTEKELDDSVRMSSIVEKSAYINRIMEDIGSCGVDLEHLQTQKSALVPWQTLEVPLDCRGGKRTAVLFGSCPITEDPSALMAKLSEEAPESLTTVVSSDEDQHYLFLIYHRSCEAKLFTLLKDAGFSPSRFKNTKGTAQKGILECDRRIQSAQERLNRLRNELEGLACIRKDLEFCFDALAVRVHREEMRSRLLRTPRTVFLEGWVPSDREASVAKALDAFGCAFEFTDPVPGDEPPVAFMNSRLSAPFGIIANLYGTPRYGSVIDPTPYMAPFFFIFFGMMVSDAAYGMILALTALWALRQLKQDGFLKQLFVLVLYCGISTMIWGILFGSWFGDIVPAVSKMLTGTPVTVPPLLVDPLKQPMEVLGLSFALGGIQILAGLWLSALRKIQTKKWLDAILDEGLWFLILIGLVLALLKLPWGLQIAETGAVGVILTAGRNEKNPVKRLLSGVLSLYKVTGYLSDVLSYSRLLALGLASGVIASVINSMGTIGGKSLGGIIALILIFLVGHAFNLAINLVGAYVHASRLQYVEFFSKFYEGGGRPFSPFTMETKYVTIQKED